MMYVLFICVLPLIVMGHDSAEPSSFSLSSCGDEWRSYPGKQERTGLLCPWYVHCSCFRYCDSKLLIAVVHEDGAVPSDQLCRQSGTLPTSGRCSWSLWKPGREV